MDRGRYCYITCPSSKPIVMFEGMYSEEMRVFLNSFGIYSAWDGIEKRWTFPIKYKESIINKAKQLFDTVYYAGDGDYETLKS